MTAAYTRPPEGGMEVTVYRSAKRAETYAFLPTAESFETLPEALQAHFGEPTAFLNFWLHEEKLLAQADAKQVLAAIAEQGFYLQLPPPKDGPRDE